MTGTHATARRWAAAVVTLASLAVVAGGLLYGVEDLVWDPAHQTHAYVEAPHATAVAWAAAAAAVLGLTAAVRVLRRR